MIYLSAFFAQAQPDETALPELIFLQFFHSSLNFFRKKE